MFFENQKPLGTVPEELRRRGRPRKVDPLRVVIATRVSPAEAVSIRAAAEAQGLTRAEFVRDAVVAAIGQPDAQRLGAVIRAERRADLLRVASAVQELLLFLRQLPHEDEVWTAKPTDIERARRALAGVHETLPELRALRDIAATEAGR